MIKSGRDTTEHARAVRVEVLGYILVGLGIVALRQGLRLVGLVLVGIGAALVLGTFLGYVRGRSDVKAAGVRRPVDQAPRG